MSIGRAMVTRRDELAQMVTSDLLTKDEAVASLAGWLLKRWEDDGLKQLEDGTWLVPDGKGNFSHLASDLHDNAHQNALGAIEMVL